jgi:hypothetical protein
MLHRDGWKDEGIEVQEVNDGVNGDGVHELQEQWEHDEET